GGRRRAEGAALPPPFDGDPGRDRRSRLRRAAELLHRGGAPGRPPGPRLPRPPRADGARLLARLGAGKAGVPAARRVPGLDPRGSGERPRKRVAARGASTRDRPGTVPPKRDRPAGGTPPSPRSRGGPSPAAR